MSGPEPIFVDSVYLIARRARQDDWRAVAAKAAAELDPQQPLVTSDGVILETLAHFPRASTALRIRVVRSLQAMRANPNYSVVPHDAVLMEAALDLYAGEFAASTLSLQDCVAIQIMREYGITSILTADQEFARAGFTPLLRRYLD